MPKFEIPTIELPTEAARPLYAGVGATDLVVGYVRDAVVDLQKRVTGVQKDVQTRITAIDLEPKALRDQALVVVTTQIDALSKEAKARREAIEKRVAELQSDAAGLPATVTAAYADLASRGEVLVGRIRNQESTKATKSAAKTTTAKAKTTKTQAT
jgi:heparin binding hemagglutinin HbhA